MNATNRGVNRAVLLLAGLLLLGVAVGVAVVQLSPGAAEAWRASASEVLAWLRDADRANRLAEGLSVSWLAVALLAVLLMIVVLAVVIIMRLGGGRTGVLIRQEAADGPRGKVTVRSSLASDAISHALAEHDEILTSRVSAHRVGGVDVLHVSVTPRQNTPPLDAAGTVTDLVQNLAALMGRDTPTLVSLRAGIRTKLASERPRVN